VVRITTIKEGDNLNFKLIQKNEPQRYILGVVYEPSTSDNPDLQGDYSTADEIEKAAHNFMKSLQQQNKIAKQLTDGILKTLSDGSEVQIDVTDVVDDIQKGALGINHVKWPDDAGDFVESYISPVDFDIKDPYGEIQHVKKGSWLLGAIISSDNFQKALDNILTGWSMGGKGVRVPDGK
jgi:hypothetical protein